MRIDRGLAVAAVFAGAAVWLATPAQADDFSGTYIRTGPDGQSTWIVAPCGPGCAHVADSTGWSADAHWINGQWTFSVDRPDATKCINGAWAPGTALYSVNPAKGAGTVVTSKPGDCPLAGGYSTPIYFTLTRAA
jgi:hypothetical protein